VGEVTSAIAERGSQWHLRCINAKLPALLLLCVALLQSALGGGSSTADYSVLMEAFCHGKLEHVIGSIDEMQMRGSSPGYRLLHLRARAAGERFLQHFADREMSGRALTQVERTELNELADRCTRAFEAAFSSAPSRYEQARLAAEWWNYRSRPKFSADSNRMREGFPDRLGASAESLRAKIDTQACAFQETFRSLLDACGRSAEWPGQTKDEFADSMAGEFRQLAVVDIPDAVFLDLLRDMRAFVLDYMPLPEGVGNNPVQYKETMRWHVWNALMCRLPDETERQAIDGQVTQSTAIMKDQIDSMMEAAGLESSGDAYAVRFLSTYEKLKDNRFIPYFKRTVPEHEVNRGRAELNEQLRQHVESWKRQIAAMEPLSRESHVSGQRVSGGQGDINERKNLAANYTRTLYALVFCNATLTSRPAVYGTLPEEFVMLSRATLNENWVWCFTVQKVVPFDALPRCPECWRSE